MGLKRNPWVHVDIKKEKDERERRVSAREYRLINVEETVSLETHTLQPPWKYPIPAGISHVGWNR